MSQRIEVAPEKTRKPNSQTAKQLNEPDVWLSGFLAVCISAALCTGCAHDVKEQVWTSKSQSSLGGQTDSPSLIVGEHLPAAPVTGESLAELREPAISVLMQAADSTNPLLRANAIEALHQAPEHLEPVVRRGLADENRGVRFVAAMTVGKLKLQSLAPLLEPLLHDDSESVQAAALYGLSRCGRKPDLNPLAAMLMGEDAEVKGNAAFVLGELGDRSATALLRNAVGRDLPRSAQIRRRIVELQLAEAMVKLGASKELEVIQAALFAPAEEGELVALACQMCGELKHTGALPDLGNLIRRSGKFERPPEVRMAAALAIARIDPTRAAVDVPAVYASSPRFELRAQAAHTLAEIGAANGAPVAVLHLARLLQDPNPLVQVAAAGGILRMPPGSAL